MNEWRCRQGRGRRRLARLVCGVALLVMIAWPLCGCATVPVFDRQAEVAARIRLALASNPQALATASPGILAVARAEGLAP